LTCSDRGCTPVRREGAGVQPPPQQEGISSLIMNLRRFPLYVLFFFLGLSIYLYLPIRSLNNPLLAWGNTQSMSGSASSVFALESLKNLNLNFLSNIGEKISGVIYLFYDQLTWACFLISLLGMIFLAKHGKKILIFLLLLIAFNCASVIFMMTEFILTNPDLHGYLLSSLFCLAFLYGLALLFIMNEIRNRSSIIRHSLFVIFLLISLLPLSKHFAYADLSSNRIAHNYGYNTIHHLDSNSVLFVDNVNLSFILRELQYGEDTRRDLRIIERGLLSFEWYVDQKRKEFKDLLSEIPDRPSGEALFRAILKKCLDQNIPTYMEFTEGDSNLVDYLVPSGYVFKLNKKRIDQIPEEILGRQKRWEKNGFLDLNDDNFQKDWDAQRVLVLSLYRLGLFYEKRGMISYALDKFEQVRKIDPHNEELMAKIEELREAQRLSEITRLGEG
ncbi:MAG: tetratricopeptide repeat protein, partial [Candidatus Zixiibacteriota bacterium]